MGSKCSGCRGFGLRVSGYVIWVCFTGFAGDEAQNDRAFVGRKWGGTSSEEFEVCNSAGNNKADFG